jgi:hypothetical protein
MSAATVSLLAVILAGLVTQGFIAEAIVAAATPILVVVVFRQRLDVLAFFLCFGGVLILSYGFANLGLPTGVVPLPLVDVVEIGLLWEICERRASWPAIRGPFAGVLLLVVFATVRLVIDYPRYSTNAVRDYTLPLEICFIFIGYSLTNLYGIEIWLRWMKRLTPLALAYFALFPWAATVAAHSPTVGLQRSVPLLGSYAGAGPAAATCAFFLVYLRPWGNLSYALAAVALGEIALFQTRGMYLALAVTVALIILHSHRLSQRARMALMKSALCVVVALTVLFLAAPRGRLGAVTPGFVVSQLGTLVGDAGPGAGSLDDRVHWFHIVVAKVEAAPAGWLVGVGLGPDLTDGFNTGTAFVRKPHDDYLEMFGRFGVVGLAVFLLLLLGSLRRILRAAGLAPPTESGFLWWVTCSAAAFVVVAATQPLLAFPYGTVPLFSLLGAGLAVSERALLEAE